MVAMAADVRFWSGWWDFPSENQYVDGDTGTIALEEGAFAPWYFGEPNGNTTENCAIVWVNRNAWNDQVRTVGP